MKKKFRPFLERLEVRECPADVLTWTGNATGAVKHFDDVGNWDKLKLPVTGDTVVIPNVPLNKVPYKIEQLIPTGSFYQRFEVSCTIGLGIKPGDNVYANEVVMVKAHLVVNGTSRIVARTLLDLNDSTVSDDDIDTPALFFKGSADPLAPAEGYVRSSAAGGFGSTLNNAHMILGEDYEGNAGHARLNVGGFQPGNNFTLRNSKILVRSTAEVRMTQSPGDDDTAGGILVDGSRYNRIDVFGKFTRVPPLPANGENPEYGPKIEAYLEFHGSGSYVLTDHKLRHFTDVVFFDTSKMGLNGNCYSIFDAGKKPYLFGGTMLVLTGSPWVSDMAVVGGRVTAGNNSYWFLTVEKTFYMSGGVFDVRIAASGTTCDAVVCNSWYVGSSLLRVAVTGGGQAARNKTWDFLTATGTTGGNGFTSTQVILGSFDPAGYVAEATGKKWRIRSL